MTQHTVRVMCRLRLKGEPETGVEVVDKHKLEPWSLFFNAMNDSVTCYLKAIECQDDI
jgi:hypothetical protein